jgi:alpha-mannosidase
VRRAAELNQPPVTLVETFHPQGELPQSDSYLSVDRENILVSVLKKAEDDDSLVLRCVEVHKEAAHGVLRLPRWNRSIEADFGPCEIKTFRVPKDPRQPVEEMNLLEWRQGAA